MMRFVTQALLGIVTYFTCAAAQSADGRLAFEVATIKLATQADLQGVYGNLFPMIMRGGPGTPRPGQISFRNASFRSILMSAYSLKQYQISGPEWIKTTGFNIEAKVPRGATKEQLKPMLQTLLAERFHLAVHRETRDLPVFALVIAKNGPKLTAAKDLEDGGGGFGPWRGNPRWVATNVTMRGLAEFLSPLLERPVIDLTGIVGIYDFTLYWAAEYPMVRVAPRVSGAEETPDPAPTIFQAVQEQLGLKLEPRPAPIEILVIDHAEKIPTEN
jgi:uncharacterized protein (TIGR03435 family)